MRTQNSFRGRSPDVRDLGKTEQQLRGPEQGYPLVDAQRLLGEPGSLQARLGIQRETPLPLFSWLIPPQGGRMGKTQDSLPGHPLTDGLGGLQEITLTVPCHDEEQPSLPVILPMVAFLTHTP